MESLMRISPGFFRSPTPPLFLSALSRRINRHISNRDKVGYDSGRNTQQNSESILTAQWLDVRSDKAIWEASAPA
jgi:hypothetical protein